ncbi:DUF7824 domain-containing protein [Streptomyces sp. NBC_01429]|uniref:DUF7824 domain-containing protein n=1 Tax=Streptomyces sp. NBC_01429 TaxID=2903862 RepID=UPI002E2DD8CA|nr:DUF6493 family protein [Streptomyces sp. NBC_01429]
MSSLADAVRAGRAEAVPGLVEPMTAAERKEALTELKALRAEVRAWPWRRWRERGKVHNALLVAGAGCLTGAADTAAWLGSREMRESFRVWHEPLLDVLADRDPKWLGNVAHRLAGRAATAQVDYPLISGLVRLAGCEVPVTDEFVYGWVDAAGAHGDLADRLRADPWLPVMVPRLFETAELPGPFTWHQDDPHHWASVLPVLAAEGVLERSLLVDATVARLLRGGRRPGDAAFFLNLLRRLEPTADEKRKHLADWIGMAADGTSTVAGHAQSVLTELAVSGALPTRELADVSGSVLFRPERKLVRAQLVLLGKALRADPGAAGELLPVVAWTFGHEDTGVQERALKLVARHLAAVDADIRGELAGAAATLAPVHRARAAEVFGEPVAVADFAPYEEILPPVPLPVRSEPAPSDLAELVEEVSALISTRGRPMSFERVLDGLVRHAHRDREALAAALREALAGRWWLEDTPSRDRDRDFGRNTYGVEVVAAAVCERVSVKALWDTRSRAAVRQSCAHTVLEGVTDARLWEVAHRVRTEPLPFLLATPTWETGALDPGVLVERLGEYRRLGLAPAPADFAQALLRVRRDGHPEAARAAAGLGTPEADRLAAWLTGDGTALPALGPVEADGPGDGPVDETDSPGSGRGWLGSRTDPGRRLAEVRQRLATHREFPRAFRWLGRPVQRTGAYCYHWEGDGRADWPKVLPQDRDTLAGWLLTEVSACAEHDQRGGAWWLPTLAESGGAAGGSLHRAVAYGLGARHPQDRLSAVDALLVLAARGDLDGRSLGEELGALMRSGKVKPNRLADSARTAAATGAYATVWSVLRAALPVLLAPVLSDERRPPAGTGEILSVAADCVERCGAAEEMSGLPELAGRGGTSRTVAQATRLLAALRQGSEHSRP